jgi:hypothetical protein
MRPSRVWISAAGVVLCVATVDAQTGRVPSVNTAPVINLPGLVSTHAALADFNGDGKQDMALGATDTAPGGVFGTLLGDGQGGFGRLTTLRLTLPGKWNQSVGVVVDGLVSGDFNEDGKPDVVGSFWWVNDPAPFATVYGRARVLLLGDGAGRFGSSTVFGDFAEVGFQSDLLRVSDFNNDGHLDLLMKGEVRLGDGQGGFTSKAAPPAKDLRVAVGDLNGDGKLDLAQPDTSTSTSRVNVHLGDGTGGFGVAIPFTVVDGLTGSQNSVIADFTGDGKGDIAVPFPSIANALGGVSVYPGDGSGFFFTSPIRSAAQDPATWIAPFSANGDALPDLITLGSNHTVGTLTTQSGGTMAAGGRVGLGKTTVVVTGDVNGDGAADIIASVPPGGGSGAGGGALQVVLGDGLGGLRGPSAIFPTARLPVYSQPVAGDFNGDGKPDLVVGEDLGPSQPKGIRAFAGNGGRFSPSTLFTWATGTSPGWMHAADFNRDGNLDLLVQLFNATFPLNGSGVMILKGNGALGFTESYRNTSCGICPYGPLTVADMDGDQNLDVIAFSTVGGGLQVYVFPGTANATLGSPVSYSTGQSQGTTKAVAAGDLNGDGKPDTVALSGASMSVLLNDGAGGLGGLASYVVGTDPAFLALGDLNEDGKLDVVVGHTNSVAQLLVFLNEGTGKLVAAPPYINLTSNDNAYSLALTDLNGDGHLDAVVQYSFEVRVGLGDGKGRFGAGLWLPVYPSDLSRTGFKVADANGDGKPDLLGGSNASQWIVLNTTALRLSVSDPMVSEGNASTKAMEFTVSLDASPTAAVAVNYITADGSAKAGSDYQTTSGTLNFAAGETSKKVTVLVNGDTAMEPEEIFVLNLNNAVGAEIADRQGIGTITNDDAGLPLVSSPLATSLGATGATLGGTVTSDSGSAITERGVVYSLQAANANPLIGGTGVTKVTVSGTTGAFSAQVTGLTASQEYAFKAYGTNVAGTGYTSVTTFATLGGPTVTTGAATNITASSATLNGTVNPAGNATTALFDYGPTTAYGSQAAATPNPGSGTSAVTVSGAVTGLVCGTTYNFRLRASSSAGPSTGSNASFKTSACPELSIDSPSIFEGNNGNILIGFNVTLSAPVSHVVLVDFATSDGTAVDGVDYNSRAATFAIPPGTTVKRLPVVVRGDTTVEPNETLTVILTNPVGATISKAAGVGTIVNDDPAPATTTVTQYRLYHDGTKEHLYTTDENEYIVLGQRGWIQEGIAYKLLTNGVYNGVVATVPVFRAYHPGILQHLWTTDSNEAATLGNFESWFYEDVIGYLLPTQAAGSVPLYRMMLAYPPIHLWTTDRNEYDTLETRGWVGEGIIGYVIP